MANLLRPDGRTWDQARPVTIEYNVVTSAHGSVLFQIGITKVLCTVILQDGVPSFLRGKGTGWLTADYMMLPGATYPRSSRENGCKKDGRSIEISRLIGRSLRAILNLSSIGERTIYIDCDVIQADGGTRTAAITGAYCALRYAFDAKRFVGINYNLPLFNDSVGALSVGFDGVTPLLDMNYQEDSSVQADFNFIMTGSGKIIEIQGAAEQAPLTWESVQAMQALAASSITAMLEQLHNS